MEQNARCRLSWECCRHGRPSAATVSLDWAVDYDWVGINIQLTRTDVCIRRSVGQCRPVSRIHHPETPAKHPIYIRLVPSAGFVMWLGGLTLPGDITYSLLETGWRGGATSRTLDLRSTGRGFKSYSEQSCVTTLGKLFTPMCLCHQAA